MREIIDQIERVGIVADDLTSAADGAGAFLKSGDQPQVCRSKQETGSARVTAIDTGSRLMTEAHAVRATAQAIASLVGCRHLYKTIDSTLRGHVRAEIAAAFKASGRARLVIAPAFPAAGRTTIDGVQRLHGEPVAQTAYGHDPVHPARTSRIADLIAPDIGRPAMVPVSATDNDIGKHIAGASVIVVDAYSQILLNRRISEIAKHGPALWVGSPGMAEALAAVVGQSPDRQTFTPPNAPRRVLVLVGSANHVSHAQCEALAAAGASVADRAEGIATTASIACLHTPRTLGVDYLLGGTHVDAVLPLIEGSGVRYYPFPGRITGHPSILEGSMKEIVASARDLASREGVHGLDLLAYRADVDAADLIRAVCSAVAKPVIVAGSIDRAERIHAAVSGDAAGFTVGTAALEGRFPAATAGLTHQLLAIGAIKKQAERLIEG